MGDTSLSLFPNLIPHPPPPPTTPHHEQSFRRHIVTVFAELIASASVRRGPVERGTASRGCLQPSDCRGVRRGSAVFGVGMVGEEVVAVVGGGLEAGEGVGSHLVESS